MATTQKKSLSVPLVTSAAHNINVNSTSAAPIESYEPIESLDYETKDVSIITALKWLIYKNFKQQFMRRPCALACKLLCPVICIVILGLIRMAFEVEPSSTYYPSLYYSSDVSSDTIKSEEWISNTICPQYYQTINGSAPAWYLAIIPPPSSNKHIEGLLNIMNESWSYHYTDQQFEEFINQQGDHAYCGSYAKYIPFKQGWLLRYFNSDSSLNNFLSNDNYGNKEYNYTPTDYIDIYKPIGTAFSFDVSDDGLKWSYSLRGNTSDVLTVPGTSNAYIDIFNRQDFDTVLYDNDIQNYKNGFLNVQTFIDNSITKYIAKLNNLNVTDIDNIYKGNAFMPFNIPQQDDFWSAGLNTFYIFLTIIQFVYPFSQSVSQLIHEKSDKIKEGMKMMGVTNTTYWISWYSWLFIECTIIALLVAGVGVAFKIYKYSNPIIIFIWIWLFCINYTCFGVLMSMLFDNPKIASLSAFLVFIVLMCAKFYASTMNESQKNALCLIGPSCFSLSTEAIQQYESSVIGIQWDNINETFDNFKFQTCLFYLFFDSIIYIILAMYLDKIWPSRYGQREHPLFFIFPSFWCPNRNKNIENINMNEASISTIRRRKSSATRYEKLENESNALIKIRDLKKHFSNVFGGGSVVRAVNGVSLDIFEGQVFCLLGHNGAGKSTTIGMLTGLLQVTDGNAWINGYSVLDNMKAIRKNIGVCPQHDVLFRRLTSKEHLELFARLKGVPERFVHNEVMNTLSSVGIMHRSNNFPPQMSGGEKRKLSLGIALIGNSKIVFLDEPTSGMDPQSRRITWNLIAKEKKRRCIILTTHFMDEADILGDRIAIMSDGLIRCCGSSLFLKRLYGVGYTFVISLKIGTNPKTIRRQIDDIILRNIAGSSCVSMAGGEISYRLPFEQTELFPNVFDILDSNKDEYNIKTYGISITTLEEVFLKIGEMETQNEGEMDKSMSAINENEEAKYDNNNNNIDKIGLLSDDEDADKNPFPQPTFQLEGESEFIIFFRHLFALLYGRFFLAIRDIRSLFCQILLPTVFALIGLLIIELALATNNPKLEMSVKHQWYSPHKYIIPMGNATNTISENINNELIINNTYMNFFNKQMNDLFGTMKIYQYKEVQVQRNAKYVTEIDGSINNSRISVYNQRSDNNNIMQYNAFFVPEMLCNEEQESVCDADQMMSNSPIYCIVNVSAIHSLPISYNILNNLILKYRLQNASLSSPEITFYAWPFAQTQVEKVNNSQMSGILVSIFLMIALTFIPMGSAYNIVNDRKNLTKHQQLVSGVSCLSYWCANYIWDFIASLPACLLIWILLHIFDTETFLGDAQLTFILILLCFCLAILPFTYLISNIFQSGDKAQVGIGAAYIVLGLFLLITSFITDSLPNSQLSQFWKDFLDGIYKIFPTFLMSHSLLSVALLKAGIPINVGNKPMDWDIAGRDLTIMICEAIGYFILVLIVEYGLLYKTVIAKWWNKNDTLYGQQDLHMDDDVLNEKNRIENILKSKMNSNGYVSELEHGDYKQDINRDRVIIANLHKVYKPGLCCSKVTVPVHAVRGVSLGVKQGEVFGYLGVNGAGKTTTLACLTGERSVTYGDAYINGYSISNQVSVRRYIGYCPQFDALFDLLTGREHLKFYGRIKGLKGSELTKQVNMLLKVLSLTKYANRRAGTYSGGNKRKLSVAISMIGNPPIVFLDEPSTGMDPMARRSMWEFIRATMSGRCVVLTTHSMEECEALCHRLCIMTNGQLKCLGTPQHLKTKYGHGYQLDIQLKCDKQDGDNSISIQQNKTIIEEELIKIFDMMLIEHNQTKIVYEVTLKDNSNAMTLAQIFRTLEECKKSLPIESYALNQTTLEQIFIKMAKQQ